MQQESKESIVQLQRSRINDLKECGKFFEQLIQLNSTIILCQVITTARKHLLYILLCSKMGQYLRFVTIIDM